MENKKVPEIRPEAKRLGLKKYSWLRKQDLIEFISSGSQIFDHPVLEIDATLPTPKRYVLRNSPSSKSFPVRPQVEVNE